MSLYISPSGAPSPPDGLSNEISDDLVSTEIKWNCPLYRGGGIVKYVINISSINYIREEHGNCPLGSSHTIQPSIFGVEFNQPYDVYVNALSICGDESNQTDITVIISASE